MYFKEEIIIVEAQKLGITINQQGIDYMKKLYYPGIDQEGDTEFFETQAAQLEMSVEEYYELWTTTYLTRDGYLQEYIEKNFEAPTTEEEARIWREDIDTHINDLVDEYKRSGQLVIN
jgi:hypothetical protein